MNTKDFKVGDKIWWIRANTARPKVETGVIERRQYNKNSDKYTYSMSNSTYISIDSSLHNPLIAKTKEELIELLYPTKIGPFDYNQLVYVIRTDNNNNLNIIKGYVKEQTVLTSTYKLSTLKDINTELERMSTSFNTSIGNIYATLDVAKEAIFDWLNKNDN